MKESRRLMINRYSEAIGRMMSPKLVILFVVIAIMGMVLGYFSFSKNPIVCVILIILSILAVTGMSTLKFKGAFNKSYESILSRYKKYVVYFIHKKWLSFWTGRCFYCLISIFNEYNSDRYGTQ